MRASNSCISSREVTLESDSIWWRWRTVPNFSCGAPPTRCVGESGDASSGCSFSSDSRRRKRSSYSASEIVGSSRT
jgi:hypothetical protein